MNQSKSRVTVDFFAHERDALQLLCDQDIRPPAEQIRWLVLQAAQKRGLLDTLTAKSLCAQQMVPINGLDGQLKAGAPG